MLWELTSHSRGHATSQQLTVDPAGSAIAAPCGRRGSQKRASPTRCAAPPDLGAPPPTWTSLSALAVSTAQAFLPDGPVSVLLFVVHSKPMLESPDSVSGGTELCLHP